MAFTSEVTAKLNLDKSGFDRAWTSTVATIDKASGEINKKLTKAFDFGSLFKGIMQGIGIGSVQQITSTITGYFEQQARAAQDVEQRTGNAVERQRAYALSVASVADRYKILGTQVKQLNVDVEMQQKLVDDLNSSPITFVTEAGRKELSDAQKKLSEIKEKRDSTLEQIDREREAQQKANREIARQIDREDELAKAKLDGASELRMEQIKLNQLQKEYNRLVKEGNGSSEKAGLNFQQQVRTQNQIRLIQQQAQKELAATYVSVGREAVSRKATLRPRGRTESERLADQAAQDEAMAREAILKGNKEGARRFSERAAGGYAKVGQRIEAATSTVKKETSDALSNQLVKANTTLEAIKSNLDPQKIQ
jgi:hypothetical protein